MKKLFVALTILVSSFTWVNAQTITVGPMVGLGLSKFIGEDAAEDSKFKLGPEFGASFIFSPQANWGIGADLLYSIEGAQQDVSGKTYKNEDSYIRLPLKFIYFFGDNENSIRPKVFLGPTLGFLMSAKYDGADVKELYNGFDFGAHVGAGANFRIANQIWLNTDVTYTHGFANVAKKILDYQPDVKTQRIALHVGVLFGI